MTHFVSNAVKDAALDDIINNADEAIAYAGGATDYATVTADAVHTFALAAGDLTKAAGTTSGRKVVCNGLSDASADASGVVNSIAFVDSVNSVVKAVTAVPQKTLNAGDPVDLAAFDLWEIEDPA